MNNTDIESTKPEGCSHDCGSCAASCSERKTPLNLRVPPHQGSTVKKVIGIASGKGGVGKSTITSLMAVSLRQQGLNVAILDADITGPSIPKGFGLTEHVKSEDNAIVPGQSKTGIKVMSINLLLDDQNEPVIWRGPMIAGVVKQFWTDVLWGDIDVMLVDLPPGTGDVPLTVFQSLPLDGVVIVTSPQQLVAMVVAKAVRMAEKLAIPVLGMIENYSYISCPKCGEIIYPFGKSNTEEAAAELDLPILGLMPIDPQIASLFDSGKIESADMKIINPMVDKILEQINY